MTYRIEAGWDILLSQSKSTAQDYFWTAERTLRDSELKYTAADVIALAQVMADDFRSTSISIAAQKLCDTLLDIADREMQ